MTEDFSAGRLSSNNNQTYQNGENHFPLGLNNVNNVRQQNNSGYTSESVTRSVGSHFVTFAVAPNPLICLFIGVIDP